MKKIGGNKESIIQIKTTIKNIIGEPEETWEPSGSVLGYLDFDYSGGASNVNQYNAKVQDTTHFFFCDYFRWNSEWTSENSRMMIDGNIYNILLIDDPMGMQEHLEIYLKYVGGGLGV